MVTDNDEKTIPGSGYSYSEDYEKTIPPFRERKSSKPFTKGKIILGHYRVLGQLGKGGMGIVYHCLDTVSGIEVAVKTIAPELSGSEWEMNEIRENFRLVHGLHHPNIANYNTLELDPSSGNYFLIMEYVKGTDLRFYLQKIKKEGFFSEKTVLKIIYQIAEALDFAHKNRILHRDIKPSNIMITKDGQVKLLDFGLAAQIHTSLTRLTTANPGSFCGTLPYMAPEQWLGQETDAAADQYALAVMTYEIFAGHLPFNCPDKDILRSCVLNEEPPELKNVSGSIRKSVAKALNKKAGNRFKTCLDFAVAMSNSAPQKKLWGWIAVCAAILILSGGALFLINDKKMPSASEPERKQIQTVETSAEEQKAPIQTVPKPENKKISIPVDQKKISGKSLKKTENKKISIPVDQKKISGKSLTKPEVIKEVKVEKKVNQEKPAPQIEAEQRYREKADSGDIQAQIQLALCYKNGTDGIKQDNKKAVEWFRKAAEKGNAEAQYHLGKCYYDATGIEQDFEKAIEWFKKSAENGYGYADAQFELGQCYEYGVWVQKDEKQAVFWYEKASKQGHKDAEFYFNVLKQKQEKQKQEMQKKEQQKKEAEKIQKKEYKTEAERKYREKAEKGDSAAQYELGNCYYKGKLGIKRDYKTAVEWFRKAVALGNKDAESALAICYINGHGIEKDLDRGINILKRLANSGHAGSQSTLGYQYDKGIGVPMNRELAVYWYRKAAEQGYPAGQYNLGCCYLNGLGVNKDYKEAVYWFRKAVEQNFGSAQNNLAFCYSNGHGVPKDLEQAVYWFKKAAEQGNSLAQCNLGACYEDGRGVKKNILKAIEWYKKAAEQGNENAKGHLKRLGVE